MSSADFMDRLIQPLENSHTNDHSMSYMRNIGPMYAQENPFREPSFRDKRFRRYMERIREQLRQYLKSSFKTIDDIPAEEGIENFMISICFSRFAYYLGIYHLEEFADILAPYELTPCELIDPMANPSIIYKDGTMVKDTVIEAVRFYHFNYEQAPEEWYTYADTELQDAVIRYLSRRYVYDDTFTKVNYFSRFPSDDELFFILVDAMNCLYRDLEQYWLNEYFGKYEMTVKDKLKEQYQTEIDGLRGKTKELSKALKKETDGKQFILPTLKRLQQEAKEGTAAQAEMYQDALIAKDREIRSLEKKLKAIEAKYERLSGQSGIPVEEEIQPSVASPEDCRMDGKYVFVMHEWNGLQQQLEVFPNMRLIQDSTTPLTTDTELVIFMTAYLSHSLYQAVKNQCQNMGVPYIHYASTNMDRLKLEIAKKCKKEEK